MGQFSLSWYTIVPIIALNAAGRRSAAVWSVITIACFAVFYALASDGYLFPCDLTPYNLRLLGLVGLTGLTMFILTLALAYEMTEERTLAALDRTEERLLRETGVFGSDNREHARDLLRD